MGAFEQDGCAVQEAWATTREEAVVRNVGGKPGECTSAEAKGEVSKSL